MSIKSLAEAPLTDVSANAQTKLWFKAKPLQGPVNGMLIQLDTFSPDVITTTNRCWFKIVLLSTDSGSSTPLVKDGRQLAWFSHVNGDLSSRTNVRYFGPILDGTHEIFRYLGVGSIIGVQICSHLFPWSVKIQGRLLVKTFPGSTVPSPSRSLSWSLKDTPEDGVYTVLGKSNCHVVSSNNQPVSRTWFKTPVLTAETLSRLNCVRLLTTARHQGWITNLDDGVWSWFEVVALEGNGDRPKTSSDGRTRGGISHLISADAMEDTNQEGAIFDRREGFISLLEVGDAIGARVCAQYPGWANKASYGRLLVQFSGPETPVKPTVDGSHIAITNKTTADILIRITTSNNDVGDEKFITVVSGKTHVWERKQTQVAFVFRNDNNQTESIVVMGGRNYVIGSSSSIPEPPVTNPLSATGKISSIPPNTTPVSSIVAQFRIEALSGRVVTFVASSTVALEAFTVDKATMTYKETEDLTGSHPFAGKIGAGQFSIVLDNSMTMSGAMTGGPRTIVEFSGSGTWALSR